MIATTHVGSLPRGDVLTPLLLARDKGEPYDPIAFDELVQSAVDDAVAVGVFQAGGLDHFHDLGLGLGRHGDFRLVPERDFQTEVDAHVFDAALAVDLAHVVVDVAAFAAQMHALAQIAGDEAGAEVSIRRELVEVVRILIVVDAAATEQDERREADAITEGVDEVQAHARTIEVGALVLAGLDDVAEQRELPAKAGRTVLTVDDLESAAVVASQSRSLARVIGEQLGVLEQIAAHEAEIRRGGQLRRRGLVGSRRFAGGCAARIRRRCAVVRRRGARIGRRSGVGVGWRSTGILGKRRTRKGDGNHGRNEKLPLHGCLSVGNLGPPAHADYARPRTLCAVHQ